MESRQPKSVTFITSLESTITKLSELDAQVVTQAFLNNNERQKLKTIKKVLESPNQTPLKSIFYHHFGRSVLREYIFGNIEAKPTVQNIFKVINMPPIILIELFSDINSFEHCKLTIQVIQSLNIAQKLTQQSKEQLLISPLTQVLVKALFVEMQKGVISIVNNQFRTKWLQHFVEVLRCINYLIKFTGQAKQKFIDFKNNTQKLAEKCAEFSYLLSKQVITQIYLIIVSLNNQTIIPESPLQRIHYLHSCTVIKGQNTLKPLLKLGSELKDTQHRSQLTPILLKAFNQFLQQCQKKGIPVELDKQLKNNAFDWAISLFDVGRSVYSYLEEIIDIIITMGGSWSLEGNFSRKFFIAKVALKHISTAQIFNLWPNCLQECFVESGNMTIAYVTECVQLLLRKIYEELGKDYNKWMEVWIQAYKKTLLSSNRSHIRGIIEFINPILLKINSSNSLLLRRIAEMPEGNLNSRLGMISILKCYKQLGKIQSLHNVYFDLEQKNKDLQKARRKQAKKNVESLPKVDLINQLTQIQQRVKNFNPKAERLSFIHLDDPNFELNSDYLVDLLLSNDTMTAQQTLEFLITTRKPSTLILPQQLNIIMVFFKNSLKTSLPEYRRNYLNLIKRFLERQRRNYEKNVQEKHKIKIDKDNYFQEFIVFLNQLIELCFENIYPDAIFEIANPALQILSMILNLFGPNGFEVRKGTYVEPCPLLKSRTTFFKLENFSNLVICLQSSYESIRSISHQIIKSFQDFSEQGIQILRRMWKQAIQNTNKLSIRSYEFACRILTYISSLRTKDKKCLISQIENKYSLNQLNVAQYLMIILKSRYEVFKNQFVEQGSIYYKNLIHGILTCFSYLLEDISQLSTLTQENLKDSQTFFVQFFCQIIKILNFSVDISSSNISTVVLDTIATGSQTDKKMTVDCRGHFLVDKKQENSTAKNVKSYLDSSALISSMENDDEGIQNTLVVSFYLLTRQSGLVFQSIGSIMTNSYFAKYVPKKQLIELVSTYFFALINLKHMGSVDRIANGLSKMAKVIFDQQDKELNQIPESLLSQLIQFLADGKFTTILRRSAGVPYAFTCLLKSEAIKRKLLIEKTIFTLLNLSKQNLESPIDLRIHALNILKKVFQDSDLKQDLDIYVSEAFITSIKGFTSEEWGVRNSSLMLFSVLANRTLGIKPSLNLLEFFHKCPDLLEFITKQLSTTSSQTMYPPLYPIVLILSRLMPFDLRERVRLSVKGGTDKQMRKQELLRLEPLVRAAGDNHNYMGRVMTAKAILPFMHLSNIIPHCLELLQKYIENKENKKIVNNTEHYRLTQCLQLLISYYEITHTTQSQHCNVQMSKQVQQKLFRLLKRGCKYLDLQPGTAPTVQEIFLRIYEYLLNSYFAQTQQINPELIQSVLKNSESLFTRLIKSPTRIGDLGHSLMYKSCIQLISLCYVLSGQSRNESAGALFLQYLNCQNSVLQNNETDYEILCLVLQKTVELISNFAGLKMQKQLKKWFMKMQINKIHNDDLIIKTLAIFTADPVILTSIKTEQLLKILQQIQKKSENKHMKVAIFEYLLVLSSNQKVQQSLRLQATQFLEQLLGVYSNPQQLQDLRQCCILYLQQTSTPKGNLLIVYIRMLEDEEYQIRKRAAIELSRLLCIKSCNEYVVTKELLHRLLVGESYVQKIKIQQGGKQTPFNSFEIGQEQKSKILKILIDENSDYKIRIKNHEEQRIFSYDKPNKYRTDINTLYEAVMILHPQSISCFPKEYFGSLTTEQSVDALAKGYELQIMQRNEYQFETVLRQIISNSQNIEKLKRFKSISKTQSLLQNVFNKFWKALQP